MASKLPHEVIIELFSRTTLNTFYSIVSTNKEFNKLKYDSYFLHLYKQRNNIVCGFLRFDLNEFAPSQESADLDFDFLSSDVHILASSDNGSIVFESPDCRYYVGKPATKQLIKLPINPKTKNRTEQVAIMVMGLKPFRYKILRISSLPNTCYRNFLVFCIHCCEVFDSTTLSWRLLEDITLPNHVFFMITSKLVTIGSSIYLLTSNYNVIDVFKLLKFESKLALACKQLNGCWEIWVGASTELWKRTFVFNEKEDTENMCFHSFWDSNTCVFIHDNILVFYNFKIDDDVAKVVFSSKIVRVFDFRSDFEPSGFCCIMSQCPVFRIGT
ncbi:hypothetical protein OSB04_001475 [Centaurea solstitialis]|uniref:F-box domain-containing protein n=1 Tax=Centaurea solstitialis TaxID=347529 RepID=A0AA38TSV6_9ASTR|nr:hypothetical protein OSB04_001475 [Centaurea solstitialis]